MDDVLPASLLVFHDAEHGLSYISLAGCRPAPQQKRVVGDDDIILDFDADGRLIGIELLRANLLLPELRERAVPPKAPNHD